MDRNKEEKMKKIETLYAVILEDEDEETLAAIGEGTPIVMQAASSNLKNMQIALAILQSARPYKKFKIVEFRKVEI